MIVAHAYNESTRTLNISFSEDLLSTNVDAASLQVFSLLESKGIEDAPWSNLRIDLTCSKMIDSTGLNLIVMLVHRVSARSGSVTIAISSSIIYQTLLFTRMDKQVIVEFVSLD